MADPIFENYGAGDGRQTFIIPLTYPDVAMGASDIERIGYGGDVWELRVDLLSDTGESPGAGNIPSVEYVRRQVQLLRCFSSMPILFTIRTESQGGKFPDSAADEALTLMLLAVKMKCQYFDVEIEWPPKMIESLVAQKESSKLVASFHDWTGDIRWTGSVLREKYLLADTFGDIIKLSILSADVYDCHELALFVRNHEVESKKPLLAVGMGHYGQLSRVLSPISLVTHRLLPMPSAPGQLTLAEVHTAQHLIGQLPKREFYILGGNSTAESAVQTHARALGELGLPHRIIPLLYLEDGEDDLSQKKGMVSFGGAATFAGGGDTLGRLADQRSDAAIRIGFVDTLRVARHGSTGEETISGENLLWKSLYSCAVAAGTKPAELKSVTVTTLGGSAELLGSVCYAAQELGIGDIYCLGSNAEYGHSVQDAFPGLALHNCKKSDDVPSTGFGFVVVGATPNAMDTDGAIARLMTGCSAGAVVNLAGSQEDESLKALVSTEPRWTFFGSMQIMMEHVSHQFTLWTGRPAPKLVIEQRS